MDNKVTDVPASFVSDVALKYGSALYRFLLARGGHGAPVSDLAQDTFERLLRLTDTDHIKNPRAYLFHVASQVLNDWRMRSARPLVVFDTDAMDAAAAQVESPHADGQPDAEELALLTQALRPLSQRERDVLLMRVAGYTLAEIAKALKVSQSTVDKTLRCVLVKCTRVVFPNIVR